MVDRCTGAMFSVRGREGKGKVGMGREWNVRWIGVQVQCFRYGEGKGRDGKEMYGGLVYRCDVFGTGNGEER